ncbi:BREX-1 system phosphatase PglZ type A [Endozoicomonas gorgoniicola]|uniref:BREX-1 system phosphatase PglZ type A n=1 Tax=Endozoicomonas gorgoniicola TaxID=1234144 RepID=A0ABT3N1R4_9GAMM|nr:BREX-1 system phosphatase PglZ type A [Endozoicomonas gorgoniicola]MCW7555577.1 BREX-1 system phosphatase PglZ type A [Endozoicomonas gorgoniicola]
MQSPEIQENLTRLFQDNRVVFWQDPDGEYQESVESLLPAGVKLIDLNIEPKLKVKVELELGAADQQFLVYEPYPRPATEEDWLLDVRFYAAPFAADRSSQILQQLGLETMTLRDHISLRKKFFASKVRLTALQKRVDSSDTATILDRKMMAVLAKCETNDLTSLVITLFQELARAGSLEAESKSLAEFTKYDLEASFWEQVKAGFGYETTEPSLKNLLLSMLVTDFHHSVGAVPVSMHALLLRSFGESNVVVCLGRWRDSATSSFGYDKLSAQAARVLKLEEHLPELNVDNLFETRTFLLVEQFVASRLRDRLLAEADSLDELAFCERVVARQSGYWASVLLSDNEDAARTAFQNVYKALEVAARFMVLTQQDAFSFGSAEEAVTQYRETFYKVDQYYRQVCEAVMAVSEYGWDLLKPLLAEVEARYNQRYLTPFSLAWGKVLEEKSDTGRSLLEHWRINGVAPQQHFFRTKVQPVLDKPGDRRVFVVISDAFRYEAAEELARELNGSNRISADLGAQLGVLPSYTKLGMAALLPHSSITYKDKRVMVDGQSSASLEDRCNLLAKVKGTAIKAETFMAMRKDEGRAFIKPWQVVYIYHNKVDAVGDSGSTESGTFDAVRDSIDELSAICNRILKSLNGTQVFVTADHGFLYQESAPTEINNLGRAEAADLVEQKKRYVLGRNLPVNNSAYAGQVSDTSDADTDMGFWIPKGIGRFHFIGGARFVHGGAMPQEVVVPVLNVKQLKGKHAEGAVSRTTGVTVMGQNFRISTLRYRFQLVQTESVSERVKPLTIKVGLYDLSSGQEPVSNVEMLKLSSTSSSLDDKLQTLWLTLKNRDYDSQGQYALVIHNAETGVEEARVSVTINLAFGMDF